MLSPASLTIAYGAATCSVLVGEFRVDEFTATLGQEGQPDALQTFTVAFSAACEVVPSEVGVLRGCIHYDASSIADE